MTYAISNISYTNCSPKIKELPEYFALTKEGRLKDIKPGVFKINGVKFKIETNDSLQIIAKKINAKSDQTGVEAKIVRCNKGGYKLTLLTTEAQITIKDHDRVLLNLFRDKLLGPYRNALLQVCRIDKKGGVDIKNIKLHYYYVEKEQTDRKLSIDNCLSGESKLSLAMIKGPLWMNRNHMDHVPLQNNILPNIIVEPEALIEEMIEAAIPTVAVIIPAPTMVTASPVTIKPVILPQAPMPVPTQLHGEVAEYSSISDDKPPMLTSVAPKKPAYQPIPQTKFQNLISTIQEKFHKFSIQASYLNGNKAAIQLNTDITNTRNERNRIRGTSDEHQKFFQMQNYIYGHTSHEQRTAIKKALKINCGTLQKVNGNQNKKSITLKEMKDLEKIFNSELLEKTILANYIIKNREKFQQSAEIQAKNQEIYAKYYKSYSKKN